MADPGGRLNGLNSPRTPFLAASCGCGSRNPVTAPGMTRSCWPRRRRPDPATAWSILAQGSAPRGWRWPNASPESSWCWSRSTAALADLARGNAAFERDRGRRRRARSDRGSQCVRRRWPRARQRRCRADESAVQRSRAASGLAGQGPRDRPCRDRRDAGALDPRGAAHIEIRWSTEPDLACRWLGRRCSPHSTAVLAVLRSCRYMAIPRHPRFGCWCGPSRVEGHRPACILALMLNDASGVAE